MKILHTVEFYAPSVGGMQEVVGQLSRRLAAMGHSVTVATTKLAGRQSFDDAGVNIVEFGITGNAVRGYSGDAEAYTRYLLDADFDVVTNFAAQQWATDLALPILPEIKAKKVFVPTGFSGLHRDEYAGYFESMKTWMRQYDANVFLSNEYRDVDFARENGIDNRVLIPNGAGADEFGDPASAAAAGALRARLGIPASHLLILHVGSHTGQKGHAEAIAMFRAARLPPSTFLLVGNRFGSGCFTRCKLQQKFANLRPGHRDRRLIVTELERAETVAAYHAADIFLFPSNIECSPLVLFECMASRTPFLTTDVGNSAEIVAWSGGGKVMPTTAGRFGLRQAQPGPGTRLLEEFANSPADRNELGNSGYNAWEKRFTWEHIANQYEELYTSLV